MIPSFIRRLSNRRSLTRKPTEEQTETSDLPSLSRHSTKELDNQTNDSLKPARSLSRKLSPASKTTSLTSKPVLAGRAPSLSATVSKNSVKKTSVTKSTKKIESSDVKTLWYLRGSYVTVMSDGGGWFLCRLQHNVYNTTKSAKIRWLSKKTKGDQAVDENYYELDYGDEIDPACILFNVRVTRDRSTYTLLDDDRLETEKLCKVAVDVASGKLTSDDVDSDVEEVVQIEPPAKKRKTEARKKEGKKKEKKDKSSKGSTVKKSPGEKKKREPKDKTKKENKVQKRNCAKKSDMNLHPNLSVQVHRLDPFFQTNEPLPFISKYAHSRLVFRAVYMKDHKLLKKLIKSSGKVRELDHFRSISDQNTALHHAIKLRDGEAIKMLYKDYYSIAEGSTRLQRIENTPADKINISKLDTGTYSFWALGKEHIRPIMASRGCREGNNALTKDLEDMEEKLTDTLDSYIEQMLETGLDFDIMKEILSDGDLQMCDKTVARMLSYDDYENRPSIIQRYVLFKVLKKIDVALERGHYKLAGNLLQYMAENSNQCRKKTTSLHYSVLISDKELKSLPPKYVTFGIAVAKRITPIHCAACNPDTRHLEKLLELESDVHLSDRQNRRLIHFAAGCEGTAPLELLIKRGARITDCDRLGNVPLHYAARANRLHNAQILLTTAGNAPSDDDPWIVRYGAGGINRPNKNSYTPLHWATESGYLDMVQLLVKNSASVNVPLNASQFKVTPLMMASDFGFYDIAVFLVDNGAVVQQRDRLGRTAVIHAAMNGNTNVLSHLLHIGASPNLCDNSGNSPLHYAAAYGWYFCVKTLLEAGADVNVGNDWKITPLSIAYIKHHTGIVSSMLKDCAVDVNFKDDAGMILLSTATASALYPDLYEQIYYLIKDKGAVCTFNDAEDATPLHQLAQNDILLEGTTKFPIPSVEAMETSVKIAQLLMDHGCDHKAIDKKGMTAAMAAMRNGNVDLFKYLVQAGCPVLTDLDKDGDNILHHLCYDHMDSMKDYLAILKCVAVMDGKSGTQNLRKAFRDMAEVYSHDGSTSLLIACQQYQCCETKCDRSDPDEDKAAVRLLWARGRDFIQYLVDEFDSDVNATGRDSLDEEKAKQAYWQGWSAAQILSEVSSCEYGGLREKDELGWPALRMFLKYKPDMNTRDKEGYTPLCGLITEDEKLNPVVTLLVKESNACVDSYHLIEKNKKKYKVWGIYRAVLYENPVILDLLVDAGANLELGDEEDGNTPLHAAAMKEVKTDASVKIIQTLLDHGAEVNVLNKRKRTPLHLVVNYTEGKMDDNFDPILAVIDEGAELTARDEQGRTPLHYVFVKINKLKKCTQHDPVELCRIITSRMKFKDLNIKDKFGMTALHWAAFSGANICCMYLMQVGVFRGANICGIYLKEEDSAIVERKTLFVKGADLNLKDNDGNTALTMAVKGKHDGCATILIQEGACLKDPVVETVSDDEDREEGEEKKVRPVWKLASQRQPDKAEATSRIPLFEYALQHELQGVFFLLMERPVRDSGITFGDAVERCLKLQKHNIVLRLLATATDVSSLHKDREHGRNLLHVLSLIAKDQDNDVIEKVASELVEKGVSLTKQDDYKCTPLLYASLNHNSTLCKFFMKTPKVYNPKFTDSFNRSILSAAFWKTDKTFPMSIVKDLREKKASLNELIDRPLHNSPLGPADPDYWRKYSCVRISPLIVAIHQHNQLYTQWSLKEGASVNMADSEGRTPIMHAVCVNDLHLVKTMLNFDFDPKAKEDDESKNMQEQTKKNLQSRRFDLKQRTSTVSRASVEEEEDQNEEGKKGEEGSAGLKEKTFKPYKKVSNVNLNALDKNGWTVMHHIVCPLSFGTFDNDEIVFILAKAGAKLNVKNKKGETPLDLAVKKGAPRIARMIQELENVSKKNWRQPKYSRNTVSDNMKWKSPPPSFHEDAERFLDELEKPMDVDEECEAKIDTFCNVTNGTLVQDEDQDRPYDVLLTKVDVNRRQWKMYNFYKIQLVHQRGKDLYILFTRWGRIGDEGQYQHTPYKAKDEAVKEFCQVFHAKTGNNWTEIQSFENKPNKYHLFKYMKRPKDHSHPEIKFESESALKSKLPSHLQHLMKEMITMTTQGLDSAVNRPNRYSSIVVPTVQIERSRLLKARDILQKISVLVDEVEDCRHRCRYTRKVPNDEKDKYEQNCQQIGALSNEYYQIIVQKLSYERLRPLDDTDSLWNQVTLVARLLDHDVARSILHGAKYREKEVNPVDYVYQSLGCQIELMAEEDLESQYILKNITCSSKDTQVEAIYRLSVQGEQARMDKKHLDNHRLLWHSTDSAQVLSILHRGLIIFPQNPAFTCHLFGSGITFSDAFSRSANDSTYQDGDSETRFMLLCEVALGKCQERRDYIDHMQKIAKEFDSVWAMSNNRPDDQQNVWLTNGCMIPLGEVTHDDYQNEYGGYLSQSNNLYTVYDKGHVCLRYLVQYRAE